MAKTGSKCYPPFSGDKGAISVGKTDLDFDVDDLERLLPRTEQRRGRGRKCRLTQWLEQHRERFGRLVARGDHTWKQLAQGLTQLGVMNADGFPLTGERLRKSWAEVEKTRVIQLSRKDVVPVAISAPEGLPLDLTQTANQHTANESLFASLEGELAKVEAAAGNSGFLMAAGRLELRLGDFRRHHEGGATFEAATKFTDESIRKLNLAREIHQQKTSMQENVEPPPVRHSPAAGSGPPSRPVQENLAPSPVRHSPAAGSGSPSRPVQEDMEPRPVGQSPAAVSGSPSRPVPKSDVLKPTSRQTREEFEALLPEIDWGRCESKLAELSSELRSLTPLTRLFRDKQKEFEAEFSRPFRIASEGSGLLERDLKEAESLEGHPDGALYHVDVITAKMRVEVVGERIERARSFSKKWRDCLRYIESPNSGCEGLDGVVLVGSRSGPDS